MTASVSKADVGHYGPGFRIFLFLVALNASYSVILFPRIASHANTKSGAMGSEVRRSLAISVPLGLLAVGSLAALAHPILIFTFGPEHAPGVTPLRILCIAAMLNLVNRHYRQVLLSCGRQATDLRLTAVGTAVHLVAKVAFIPTDGIAGAAMGTVVGDVVLLVGLYLKTRPMLKPHASEL
jgi:O-antigen/teichoic acid export membrane protein